MTQPQQQLQPHHSLKLQNNGMNRLSRVFLIPLTTLVCTKILILSLFYEQYPHQFQRSSNNNKKEAGNLRDNRPLIVSEMRFELTRANAHYPLKVACLPIPPRPHSVKILHYFTEFGNTFKSGCLTKHVYRLNVFALVSIIFKDF